MFVLLLFWGKIDSLQMVALYCMILSSIFVDLIAEERQEMLRVAV